MSLMMPRGDVDSAKGVWEPAQRPGKAKKALISCPKCGRVGSLSQHEIADDGMVTPSLVCPFQFQGCDFHEWVKLEGWQP